MSADDTWIVAEVQPLTNPTMYGVFHAQGDGNRNRTKDRAVGERVFSSAITAILYAHRLNWQTPAEYGVWVTPAVLSNQTIQRRIERYFW